EPKANIKEPEVQSTKENRNSCDRAELLTCGPLDERNKQQRDGQEAQGEEEERRKLRNAHFDGHELITPEQGDGHGADDLDGRHGTLSFKTDQSKYRRTNSRGVHGCCLPNEAAEKSVSGGLRCVPCRCRFADHAQPLDETDENSGGS